MVKKVLLVDDDFDVRSIIRDLLESRSWEVTEAVDGIEALKILRDQTFSIIITDMIMPNMDGHSFVNRCKRVSVCPIVCLSGTSLHLQAIKMAEVDAVFEKPIDAEKFADEIEKIAGMKKKY